MKRSTSTTSTSLRVAGLFAGIGGIEAGLKQAGHETELLCEIDPGAVRVLKKQFPGSRVANDVKHLKAIGDVDLVTAGFPCQDLSQARRTAGIRVRRCPPEDCGGVHGYEEFLKAIANRRHPEHRSMLEWAGGTYDPDAFDPKAVVFDNSRKRWKKAFER